MYQDDEADWQILKDYKKKKKARLQEDLDYHRKVKNSCEKRLPATTREVQQLEAEVDRDQAAGFSAASGEEYAGGPPMRAKIERDKTENELREKRRFLESLQLDIDDAFSGIAGFEIEINDLTREIQEIEEKIRAIRSAKHARQKQAKTQDEDEPIQKCKRKCTLEDITVSCAHSKRGFKLAVPPMEATGGEVPSFHVISGADSKSWDEVVVNYSGACGYGLSSSAPDTKKVKEKVRVASADSYCPRVQIQNTAIGTSIDRPNGVAFAAIVPKPFYPSPMRFIFQQLQKMGRPESQTYDMSFLVCGGTLPYRAQVHAYLPQKWEFALNFGYAAKIEHKKLEASEPGHLQNYDGIRAEGSWKLDATWALNLDGQEISGEHSWNPKDFAAEIGRTWSWLESMQKFFDPLSGLLENALGSASGSQSAKELDASAKELKANGKAVKEKSGNFSVGVDWPKLSLSGKYELVELANKSGIGGQGELVIGFQPLFGITATIELMPYLLSTMGGPFGAFLHKVANMSLGDKEKGNYAKTELSLTLKGTGTIGGSLKLNCTPDKGWGVDGSGIEGFMGLEFAGKVAAEGKLWVVKFECGAQFRTTDETGKKPSGIEVQYTATSQGNRMQMVGGVWFNGLAIVYAMYAKGGVDALTKKKPKHKVQAKGYGGVVVSTDGAVNAEKKFKDKVVIMNKRKLFADEQVPIDA